MIKKLKECISLWPEGFGLELIVKNNVVEWAGFLIPDSDLGISLGGNVTFYK